VPTTVRILLDPISGLPDFLIVSACDPNVCVTPPSNRAELTNLQGTYYIVVGRSTSITGPYVDKAGVAMLSGGGTVLASSGSRFKGPGGQSLLSDGSVMAWHAYDASNNGAPVLFINDVTWGSDGWPQAVW